MTDPGPARTPFVMIPVDVLFDPDISDKGIRLYALLVYHRNQQTGQCNPARSVLADELGCTVRQVSYLCAELERAGIVERTIPDPGGVTYYLLPRVTNAIPLAKNCKGGVKKTASPPCKKLHPPLAKNEHLSRAHVLKSELEEVNKKKGGTPLPPKVPEFPPEMIAFWDALDAKGRERSSRSEVLTEWKRLRPDEATVAEIMAGVAAWNASASWRDGYAPGAHRFLKLRKWQERPAAERSPPPRPNGGTGRHDMAKNAIDYFLSQAGGSGPPPPDHDNAVDAAFHVRKDDQHR